LAVKSSSVTKRVARAFTCTPVGLNPKPLFEIPVSQTGGYTTDKGYSC
jgi:hypothetical protein